MSGKRACDIDGMTVAKLARGVKLHEDHLRGQTILLAPERALALDEIAVEIVKALDGVHTIEEIAGAFAVRFEAPQEEILRDIIDFVREFSNRRLLDLRR